MSNTSVSTGYVKGESAVRSSIRYKDVPLKGKGTLKIDSDLLAIIAMNHYQHKNVEWSGFLFYKIESGDITDPDNLVIVAEGMFIQDIGSGAYTDFTMDSEKILDMVNNYPDYENSRIGLIHTHHNMSCFFSGTDMDELHDNAANHIMYLSLIVNVAGPWCAKIAIPGKINTRTNAISEYKDKEGNPIVISSENSGEEDALFLIDLNIQHLLPAYYIDQYEKVLKDNEKKRVTAFHTPTNTVPVTLMTGGSQRSEREIFVDNVRKVTRLAFAKLRYPLLNTASSSTYWGSKTTYECVVEAFEDTLKLKGVQIPQAFIENVDKLTEDIFGLNRTISDEFMYTVYCEVARNLDTYRSSFVHKPKIQTPFSEIRVAITGLVDLYEQKSKEADEAIDKALNRNKNK
jgi:proteasome lid subunit RPN8/RPN11